jgi:hypothetical protein
MILWIVIREGFMQTTITNISPLNDYYLRTNWLFIHQSYETYIFACIMCIKSEI